MSNRDVYWKRRTRRPTRYPWRLVVVDLLTGIVIGGIVLAGAVGWLTWR